ncbi:hypothetical protein ACIF8T_38080 [Streptomyces sp. NPDC085946]|uniref:hypothetical protein n=1 Tax=Streptomyces sp. NPDC085946 TaxID=3365744 RepID=UPI0037D5B205
MALLPETDFTQILRLLNWTVPPGLVLPLRRPSAADIFTDRELMLMIFNFPNPNLRLSTLMVLGADTVVLQRPS